MGAPSKLRFTRKAETLAMIFPTLDLSNEDTAARRRWKYEALKFDSALTELLKP
jgi:hypothetical protein